MNDIRLNGTQDFMGISIPVIEGGFGEDCKCISDKTISEIHNMLNKNVRSRITDNINRFKESIDYLDLKQHIGVGKFNTLDLTQFGYTKMAISKAESIFLLSERGYAKLINLMDDKKSIGEKFQREYFKNELVIIEETDERKENLFFNKLCCIFDKLNLHIERQYSVDKYRLDGYIP